MDHLANATMVLSIFIFSVDCHWYFPYDFSFSVSVKDVISIGIISFLERISHNESLWSYSYLGWICLSHGLLEPKSYTAHFVSELHLFCLSKLRPRSIKVLFFKYYLFSFYETGHSLSGTHPKCVEPDFVSFQGGFTLFLVRKSATHDLWNVDTVSLVL